MYVGVRPYSVDDTRFLTQFHERLSTTTGSVSTESVRTYWNIMQAHLDARWRLPAPSDAYFTQLAAEMTRTRQLDGIYRTPPESAMKILLQPLPKI